MIDTLFHQLSAPRTRWRSIYMEVPISGREYAYQQNAVYIAMPAEISIDGAKFAAAFD